MRKPVNAETYIIKIKRALAKTRFSQLKIDDIAKYMDISKVTLYKHFSSKDEIIRQVIDYAIRFMEEGDAGADDDSVSCVRRFQETFLQSLISVFYISDLFIQDLKEFYPHLYEILAAAQQVRHKKLQAFFEAGMDRGIFNRLNARLFMVQDDAVLRRFLEPSFSIQYDITLKAAILDYYQMKKTQLLAPEYLSTADDSAIEKELDRILQNFS